MPGGDRTGPRGMGPLSGRGAGFCAGYSVPGYMNPGVLPRAGYFRYGRGFGGGMGMGRGFGFGRGWRHWYHATGQPGWARGSYGVPEYYEDLSPAGEPSPDSELAYLKAQAKYARQSLDDIEARIAELKDEADNQTDKERK